MTTKPCRRCGGVMRATTGTEMITVAGLVRPVTGLRHWTCEACGAQVETPDQIDGNAALIADIRAADQLLKTALALTNRRQRLCRQSACCPACKTRQVQLLDCRMLATWRCRQCRHTWRYEPLGRTA